MSEEGRVLDRGPQVAVEIDLWRNRTQQIETLRLCNFGPLFSIHVPGENYEPRLVTPIQLGVAVSVQSYGQPARELSNQGQIVFILDIEYAERVFDSDLHWTGRTFRVYEGQPTGRSMREDLDLVFVGRINEVSHNTRQATVRTGDASIDLDQPLVTDLYPATALPANVGNPLPYLLGTVFNIEPVLIDATRALYQYLTPPPAAVSVFGARVGGIDWFTDTTGVLDAGLYREHLDVGTIHFGSEPIGGGVRCDVVGPPLRGVGDLISQIGDRFGVPVDPAALSALDDTLHLTIGVYYRDAVNALSYLDDSVTGCACWWGITKFGLLTGGIVMPPAPRPTIDTMLDNTNVLSLELSQMIPPAWRVRVEFERHWQPENQFLDVDEDVKQRWSSTGKLITREDPNIKRAEPRSFDVPTMRSITANADEAQRILDYFWDAWSVRRSVLSVQAMIDSREVELYETIAVDYMMFRGNYRIISATPSIGGGPTQLQLWG